MPGRSAPSRLRTWTSVSRVRVLRSRASAVRVIVPVKVRLGSSRRYTTAFWPTLTSVENICGTFAKTRSVSIRTRWNISRVEVLSAVTRSPGSKFRAVMTPANGAVTFWNDCMVSSRWMLASFTRRLASAARTLASATLSRARKASNSCCGDGLPRHQLAGPQQLGVGEFTAGLIARQVGPAEDLERTGLLELGVDLRRGDLRQQIALLDAVADVDPPALEITRGPRVDRRFQERVGVARQDVLGSSPRPSWQ